MWSYADLEYGIIMLSNAYNKRLYSTSKSHTTNNKSNMCHYEVLKYNISNQNLTSFRVKSSQLMYFIPRDTIASHKRKYAQLFY